MLLSLKLKYTYSNLIKCDLLTSQGVWEDAGLGDTTKFILVDNPLFKGRGVTQKHRVLNYNTQFSILCHTHN